MATSMSTTDANAPNSTGHGETPAGSSSTSASGSCAMDRSSGNGGNAHGAASNCRDDEADDDEGQCRSGERACTERRQDQIRVIDGETGKHADGDGSQFANAVAHACEQQRQDRHGRSEDESGGGEPRPAL